jgi:hypothetical protein
MSRTVAAATLAVLLLPCIAMAQQPSATTTGDPHGTPQTAPAVDSAGTAVKPVHHKKKKPHPAAQTAPTDPQHGTPQDLHATPQTATPDK